MHRIDSANARPDVNGTGKKGFHSNEDLSGQDATYVTPTWCNAVQEELCNAIGLNAPLDKANNSQLKAVFQEMDTRLGAAIVALGSAMQQAIINERNAERDRLYPIGRGRYITYDATNPATFLGFGTWTLDTANGGRVLIPAGVATDDNGEQRVFIVGGKGGEYKHTLTALELPSITLKYDRFTGEEYGEPGKETVGLDGNGNVRYSEETEITFGNGASHENMQPWLVVNVWLRTG